jgi:broad specificity phosphatase PhoE
VHVPSSNTTLYLVRHGQTAWNLEQRFQGQLDQPLDDLGERQASAVARWLRDQQVEFSAVYSSDLQRAAYTADTIGREIGFTPMLTPELREIDCGEWAGLTVNEVEARYPGQISNWDEHVDSFTLPGGESIPDVRRRAGAFVKGVAGEHTGKSIVVVGHGMVLAALLIDLLQWDLLDVWKRARPIMGNTGLAILLWDQDSRTAAMPTYNSQAHLAGLPISQDLWSRPSGRGDPTNA